MDEPINTYRLVYGTKTQCPRCNREIDVEIYDGGGVDYCCEFTFHSSLTYITEITASNKP